MNTEVQIRPSGIVLNDLTFEQQLEFTRRALGYKRSPVSIMQFISDPYYLGEICKELYPYWVDKLKQLYPTPIHTNYPYLSLGGAIGTGKSTFARILAEYQKHRLMCLENIHETFHLMPGKNITFSFFHNNQALAYSGFIDVLNDWDEMSPYFKDLKASGALDEITIVADAPRSKAQIGEDVIFYNLSELNFMNYDTAWGKLNDALTRFASRFKHMVDFFGHVIIDTSAQGDDSISDYFDSVADQKFPGQVMQFRTCQWEAKEALYHYSKHEHFKVYKGDSVHQPFIVSESRPIMADMDLDRFIEVPIDFKPEFESDIYQALQDLAGVSTNSTDRFFPNPENLLKCFKLPMYSKDVIKVDFFDPSDKLIYHLNRYLQDIPTDRILYIHYDIGVNL